MSRIYLDYAAATPLSPTAWMAMEPLLLREYGNPSSAHTEGVRAKKYLDHARMMVAQSIGAHVDEIIFTAGATESINLAIFGAIRAAAGERKHIVTVATEHSAVLEAFRFSGAEVTLVNVDAFGRLSIPDVIDALRETTVLVSVMMVNNEIGVKHDLEALGRALDAWRKERASRYPLLHTDASQAPNYEVIDVRRMQVDLLTLSSAKVYGPKGVGALFARRHAPLAKIFGGGKQEYGHRAGTENVAGIFGFATALQEAVTMREQESARILALRERFIDDMLNIPGTRLNGHRLLRVANNAQIFFSGIEAEELVLRLDAQGVAVSAASACHYGAEPSHVLMALGCSQEEAQQSIRFSLGRDTQTESIDRACAIVRECVGFMRRTQE